MADFMEPTISESSTTLIGTATWNFDIDTGYTHDNTQITGGTLTLVDTALPGTCVFPLFIPPTFTGWISSTSTKTALVNIYISTPYQPTYQVLPTDMSTISERGDQCTLKVVFPAGAAQSVSSITITYTTSFSSETDIDYFTDIDDEKTSGQPKFSTTEKRYAIQFANAKVLYMLKDYANFYTDKLDKQIRKLIKQAESYYAIADLFDIKGNQFLNIGAEDQFSVGDMSVNPDNTAKKEFGPIYKDLANQYNTKADRIIGMIMPPGTDSVRTTFVFDTCDEVDA